MRFEWLPALILGFLFPEAKALRAEENPRALIDRAIQAQGGEAKLTRIQAVASKVKGSAFAGDTEIRLSAEFLSQSPDLCKKQIKQYLRSGETATQIQVYNGNKVWVQTPDGLFLEIAEDLRKALLIPRYVERVAGLIVLKEESYQLSWAGTSKVMDKEAAVVKVASAGQPDVRLFFDRDTGLLLKTEHRQLDPRSILQGIKEEIVQETIYSDYRIPDSVEADEKILQLAKVPTDGPGLLEFFRGRSRVDREKIATLVRQLGDKSFSVREKASQELVTVGEFAVPFLKEALKSRDLEVVRRADSCLQIIQPDEAKKEQQRAVRAAAVRLLAARKPEGTTDALLAFLPGAGDEIVEREIRAALAVLAMREGKPDPVLVQALQSKNALCQSVAAEALGKVPLPPGRKIIVDGVKRPMKAAIYRNGKLYLKWEVLEVTCLNKLDDKLFANP